MAMTRNARLLLAAAVLAACTGDGIVAVDDPAPAPRLSASGLKQRVTGHANVRLSNLGNAEQRYSNAAVRHADGGVSGEFQVRTEQTNGGSVHGSVLCFTVAGNTARLAGVVERSTAPVVEPGQYLVWTVVDNGEGRKSPPDQTSDFAGVTASEALAHCATGYDLPLLPVLGGNLQIHP